MVKRLVLSVGIEDCEVQHFRSGGAGGQNQNKRDTGTRVIHHPSGARGESREERSQLQNKKTAFRRMTETVAFKIWMNRMLMDKTPEERVAEMMDPKNLLVEVQDNGKWVHDG